MSVSPKTWPEDVRGAGEPVPRPAPFDGKERRREDARLRTLVTMNVDGLLVVGRDDGLIRFANPAAATLLGQSPDQLIGQPFGTPVIPGQAADIDVCAAGERCVAEIRSTAVEWDGAPSYLVALRDVTEQRRQRQEYLEALDRERQSRHA